MLTFNVREPAEYVHSRHLHAHAHIYIIYLSSHDKLLSAIGLYKCSITVRVNSEEMKQKRNEMRTKKRRLIPVAIWDTVLLFVIIFGLYRQRRRRGLWWYSVV